MIRTRHWDRAAPRYDAATAPLERRLLSPGRQWVCSRARGRVLEIGFGTGSTLTRYGPDVLLTAVDASAPMLQQARRKVGGASATVVALLVADAEALPFEDGSFDAVVSTYVLCCVPDLDRALGEAVRVLRPGGDLLLADHVASTSWPVRLGQRALERLTVPRTDEHFTRRPAGRLPGLGVEVVARHRHALGVMEAVHGRAPAAPEPG